MDRYSLRYCSPDGDGERTVAFYAHSTSRALDLAKEAAGGDWAELYLNGKSVCRMRLVEETGVWLVERSAKDAGAGEASVPMATAGAATQPDQAVCS
ncbi:MAG: hypothetical protein WA936_05750 [Erythrobacter sp.]|uniref:hypothetical protein n=1 Tax=Erythrobacter sp. TaxID=1042 RepID=UPI003C714CCA